MYASLVAALALAASVSQVAAGPINHVARGYAQDADLLEDYTPYHVRYLALGCSGQHGSDFFEECCHPLLRWQKLSDRPARCIPSASASSSAVLAEPTATPIDEDPLPDYDDCDDVTSTPAAAVASSTKYVAPEPTTTKAPASTKAAEPATSTSQRPETTKEPETTSEKPSSTSTKPSATPAPETGSGDAFTGGFATFFTQNGNAGACGDKHDDYDLIVAADYRRYGALNQKSDLCGKKVVITNTDNGKTVTAIIADACPTCTNSNSLDLSLGAFDKLGARETGMLPISWYFA